MKRFEKFSFFFSTKYLTFIGWGLYILQWFSRRWHFVNNFVSFVIISSVNVCKDSLWVNENLFFFPIKCCSNSICVNQIFKHFRSLSGLVIFSRVRLTTSIFSFRPFSEVPSPRMTYKIARPDYTTSYPPKVRIGFLNCIECVIRRECDFSKEAGGGGCGVDCYSERLCLKWEWVAYRMEWLCCH